MILRENEINWKTEVTRSLNLKLCSCQDAKKRPKGPGGGRKGRPNGPNVPKRNVKKITISGGYDEGVPPVPIPNTEVKPFSADGTWLVTARESRSPPDSK